MNARNKNNIIVQGSVLAAASIIVRLIGLLYRIPLTRILGDEALGYYSVAYEFYNLALLLSSYSLPLAVSKLVSTREIKGEYKNAHQVFRVALVFGFTVGAIATAVVFFGADFFAALGDNEYVAIPLRVLAPTILVFSVMGVIRGYFQGKHNMVPTAFSQVIEQIVNAIVSIAAASYMMNAYLGDDAREAYGAAGGTMGTFCGALAAFAVLIVCYVVARPKMLTLQKEDISDYEEGNRRILRAILATVLPVVVAQTIYQLSGTLDNIVFHSVLSAKGVEDSLRNAYFGIYSGKYKLLTNLPVAIATAMGTAIVPNLIADYTSHRMDELKEKIASAVKVNMIVAIPAAVGLGVLGGPILQILFDDHSSLGAGLMAFGSVSVLFFALSTVTNGVLQGINRLHMPVINSAISLALHVALLWGLLRFTNLGAYALVIGNVTFALVVCVLNWITISRCLDYRQEIVRTFLLPLFASAVMGLGAYGVYWLLASVAGNFVGLAGAIVVAVVLYFVVLILIHGVTEEELRAMPKGRLLVRLFKKIHLLK